MNIYKLTLLALFGVSTTPCYSEKVWIVGVIPQQSATKLTKLWKPLLDHIARKTGEKFKFQASPNFKTFEKHCAQARFDFVYLSPAHYTTFQRSAHYNAIAKAKNKKIQGIIVVAKDSPLKNVNELNKSKMIFPPPTAFAASIIPKAYLKNNNIKVSPAHSINHDNVYYAISLGLFKAGGGVIRTFNATNPVVKKQLRILWTSKKYTPHAIAAHQRVPASVAKKFQEALVKMSEDPKARKLYQNMKIKYGFERAKDSDWSDVRALGISIIKE